MARLRPAGPLWLRAPGRAAGLPRATARRVIAATALLLFILMLSAWLTTAARPLFDAELALQEGVVSALAAGGEYYAVATDALRAGGQPVLPFTMVRLPTLTIALAALPPATADLLMIALAALAGFVWIERLRRDALASVPPMLVAGVALAAGLVLLVRTDLTAAHSGWAGLFVAFSLGLYRPGDWLSAAALGLCGALIHEMAGLYLVVMAAFALVERRRGEAIGWFAALSLLAVALGFHAIAVASMTGPLDGESQPLVSLGGAGLYVRAVAAATALDVLPLAVSAPLVAFALIGWAGWRHPVAARAAALLWVYALVIAVFALPQALHLGFLVAPIVLIGLAFLPDTIRDLTAAALDRRRVRVHRVTR